MERSGIASCFERAGFHVVLLDESRIDLLQDLYARCSDFIRLVTGHAPRPTDARDLLRDLPPGKSSEDKYVLGFTQNSGLLVGVLDVVQGYPDPVTWYIGLLMLDPQERGQGLGEKIYKA